VLGNGNTASTVLSVNIDHTAPTLVSSTPADDATAVSASSNLTFTFSEDIAVGLGNIVLKNITDGTSTNVAVTDTSQVSISGKTLTLNPNNDLVGVKSYAIQIDVGAVTDVAGNAYAGISDDTTLSFVTKSSSLASNLVISLGTLGQLITPVQVENKWYYQWDVDGDGNITSSDRKNLDELEILGFGTSTGTVFTEGNRTFTLNGVQLALPTIGASNVAIGAQLGTSFSNTTGRDTTDSSNAVYDDFLAIWDSFNGSGLLTGGAGQPSGLPTVPTIPVNKWSSTLGYWSATPGTATGTSHMSFSMANGSVSSVADNTTTLLKHVVFQVL
jgi:methionine-rich copper-binding protein CopC